ncbi:lactate permease LctP family transporter [Shigella boydii]|uniref:L-lactate permease n=1 Tax=Shigella boydii TaxID=621 RepID=A0A7G6K7M2_SHIBO|nr:lactate permease LctP family transporter [Shigella boydii]EFZ0080951.1 glycolate permease glcA [Shigella flexneri]EFS3869482.1 glycolate permease glcA [Shigella boydii]EFZ0032290.1 glycolate permease glcA [Shigella boydii]EFZ6264225.1 glycolate permease glcA [Shigella boydii]EFZ6280558.1 glycolate permease glcA [Shigella boydii]
MVTWTQMYMPMGGLGLSALVALIPIIFFFVALAVLRLKGHVAGAITLILSILIAIFAFKMPIDMAFAVAGYGFIYGLWPIAWIIVAAVFLYKLTVASGQFDIIRSSVISITDDQRLQVLLIGFSFGALLEGAAGFGAPVAITGALLVGLGFKPLYAAGLCLIANTAPVAFGALGVPILVAGQVTGIDPFHIGAMAGRQLPFLSVLVPFWLVAMMDGWKGVKETWPAALVSIVSLALFLKVWRPKNTETAISMGQSAGAMVVNKPSSGGPVPSEYSLGQIIRAWSPFLILTVLVTIWTMKPFKALFAPGGAFYSLVINFQIPHLHQQVLKAAPIVAQPTPMDAVFKFDPLSAGGTAIFIAAIISIFILGVGIKKGIGVFAETLISLKWPILSIGMVLAFAFVTNYSGMSTTLALVLACTGVMFPFFSPFLGWLGVFLTGSDTSSNALFGLLQSTTAQQINVSDTLLVAANTSGGVTGKMISPQSIAVACAATGMVGRESELFRYTVKHSLIFASVIGIITLLQAYVFTGMLVS